MNDFMRWLYANYISPQLKQADRTGYEQALSLMEMYLDPNLFKEYHRTSEHWNFIPAMLSFWGFAPAQD